MGGSMYKSRLIEVTVTVIFIGSLILYLFFGFQYFAGFKYAPTINKIILTILAINICLGLLYFGYRFIKWVIRKTKIKTVSK